MWKGDDKHEAVRLNKTARKKRVVLKKKWKWARYIH